MISVYVSLFRNMVCFFFLFLIQTIPTQLEFDFCFVSFDCLLLCAQQRNTSVLHILFDLFQAVGCVTELAYKIASGDLKVSILTAFIFLLFFLFLCPKSSLTTIP